MWTALGTIALVVAGLMAGFLLFIGLSNESGRDGGRAIGTLLAGLPFALCLLVAAVIGLAQGGFDWVLPSLPTRAPRVLLVLAALIGAVLIVLASVALRLEPRSQMPWALWPLRSWGFLVWLPAALAAVALALYPAWRAGLPTPAWQWPLAALGAAALVVGVLFIAEWMWVSVQQQRATIRHAIDYGNQRDASMLQQVQAADVEKDFVSLLPHTSPYETREIRELALDKLRSHPDLNGALARLLRNAWAEEAFTFLAANDPPDAAALAEPVREGVLSVARQMQERVREAHTLRPDDYEHIVKRVITTVDRYAAHGVDYVPAMRELRLAFDARQRQPVDFTSRHLLDAWLKKHAKPG